MGCADGKESYGECCTFYYDSGAPTVIGIKWMDTMSFKFKVGAHVSIAVSDPKNKVHLFLLTLDGDCK